VVLPLFPQDSFRTSLAIQAKFLYNSVSPGSLLEEDVHLSHTLYALWKRILFTSGDLICIITLCLYIAYSGKKKTRENYITSKPFDLHQEAQEH